jgi:hypothetical protein
MSFREWKSLMRSTCIQGSAAILLAGLASAQSTVTTSEPNSSGSSSSWSSSESTTQQIAEASVPGSLSALPSAPAPSASAAAQESTGGGYSGWHGRDIVHRLAFEAGGGFNAPAGDKDYITWGGQFTVGAGVNFNDRLAMLIEYQFLGDKIPGAVIAESGAEGGHYHIWSFTLAPVVDLFPKATNDIYVTGGGGFYRKVTDFTEVEPSEYCTFYGCGTVAESATVGSFSSNQGGFNVGAGFQHRIGGMYGDGKTKLFAEVRYLYLLSPAVNGSADGLGVTAIGADTKVLPISVGVRW